ncbi:MAG TPA: YidC/Oxa1 family membrane protein insertase [Actinomycetes bacterium]
MIELFDAFRDALYTVLKTFQHISEPLLGSQSYWFSIVMLTVAVRVVLIPLTVKQVRSTRVMQELQPEIKKLQAKYKGDKQKLTEETMKLYQEKGFNPLSGCWPLLAQMPFFFALYRVIYSKHLAGEANILLGKKFFIVPLSDTWSRMDWAHRLTSPDGLIILALILAMSLTTYISQRQLLSRQGAAAPPQQQMLIKILPFTFLIFAINVPLAIIIYWVTTNLWSMGQQYVLLRSAPPPPAAVAQPATANGGERKPAGALGFFRSLVQPTGEADAEPSANGGGGGKVSANRPAAKGSPKAARATGEGKATVDGKASLPDKGSAPGKGPPSGRATSAGTGKGSQQAKPGTGARGGQSSGSGSRRSSRKGKSGGGPRRGKR